jgi:hypothetical protein
MSRLNGTCGTLTVVDDPLVKRLTLYEPFDWGDVVRSTEVRPLCPVNSSTKVCANVVPIEMDDDAPVEADKEGSVILVAMGSTGSSNLQRPRVESFLTGKDKS